MMISSASSSVKSEVAYQPLCKDEHTTLQTLTWKQKWLPCGSLTRRMHIMVVLCACMCVWIFIYYKLLHHHFELPEPLRELRKMFGDGEVKKRRGREDETEVVNTISERLCLPQFQSGERSSEMLHFAIVGCEDRSSDALLTMKSVVLFTNSHVHFHIFTDDKHIKSRTYDSALKLWPAWKEHWLMYTVHPVRYSVNEEKQSWFKQYKPCSAQSLFLANILSDVDLLIYVKPDILFLDAPENLWSRFRDFNRTHVAGLTQECGDGVNTCQYSNTLTYPYVVPYGVSSNIMLMNLTRMRQLKWERHLVDIYTRYKKQLTYGDQDILNIYFATHPNSLFPLECYWNYRPRFCTNNHSCMYEVERAGVSALHRGHERFGNANLGDFFGVFASYKFSEEVKEKLLDVLHGRISALQDKYDLMSCGNVLGNVLRHITC